MVAPRAERVIVFRSRMGHNNIAHLIDDAHDPLLWYAECGRVFTAQYDKPTDHHTRLCVRCVKAKDRRDCDLT